MSSDPGDIAVIGAGIIGVAAAEWLRRSGHRVTLIDRLAPGEATSFGNAGLLARGAILPAALPGILAKVPAMLLSRDQPLFLRWSHLPRLLPWLIPYIAASGAKRVGEIAGALAPLVMDSIDQHKALAKGTPAEKWINDCDCYYLYRDRAAFDADGFGWQLRRNHGIKGEAVKAADLKDHDPYLGPHYQFGYKMNQFGFIGNPGQYVKDLAAWFTGQGGRFLQAGVDDIEATETGATLVCGGETHNFDKVVVATGAWSAALSKQLGVATKLESERGYHMEFVNPSNMPPSPYLISDTKVAATPMDAGLRIGGIVEFAGLTAPPAKQPPELLLKAVRRLYPDFSYESKTTWMGHRPSTPDSLPVLGCAEKSPHVFFAYGHQHIGLTAGAKTGRLIAQMVSGAAPNIDMSAYSPDRFA